MKEWWNWLKCNPKVALTVVLPTVLSAFVGILGVTSEIYTAYTHKVGIGRGSYAAEQVALWQKNASCMQNAQFSTVKNPSNIEVSSLVCQTGDVLISVKRPDALSPSFRWIGWDNVTPEKNSSVRVTLFPEANADITLCFVQLSPYHVKYRMQNQYGCYDMVIFTPTGVVTEYYQVDCRRGCS
jgi:hypothetical protein